MKEQLTVSTRVTGMMTPNDIHGGNLNVIHGKMSRRNQGLNYPEAFDVFERPLKLALRQGQTGTTGAIFGTTSGTTLENEYIPYWPKGEWVLNRYGEVCGRANNQEWNDPLHYKTFKNMCELEKENWKGYRYHKSIYFTLK